MYRMNLIMFERDWLEKLDILAVTMIMHNSGLPATADKELFWTKKVHGGRGLLKLTDLQSASYINYNTMHILNNESIGKKCMVNRMECVGRYLNKNFLLRNCNQESEWVV
jgi:hypothetical protein